MDIVGIFYEVSKAIRSDFERAQKAIEKHPGLKGNSCEDIFRKFLRAYLPESLDIATGLLVDSFRKQYIHFIFQRANIL